MILGAYLTRRYLLAIGGVTIAVFVLYFLFQTEKHISSYGDLDLGTARLLGLTLLKTPESVYAMLPVIVAVAALLMSLRLSTASEMPVIRTFGKSAMWTLGVPATIAVVLGVMAFMAINPVVAWMSKTHRTAVTSNAQDVTQVFFKEDGLIWLRQVIDNQQTVIRASSTRGGKFFGDVHVFMFDAEGTLTRRLYAVAGELVDDLPPSSDFSQGGEAQSAATELSPGFCMYGMKAWNRAEGENIDGSRPVDVSEECLKTRLTPDQIRESLDPPESVSFWKLGPVIKQLEEAGFSSTLHRIHQQTELAKPLLLASMVLLGGCFALRPNRFGNMPLMITISLVAIIAAIMLGNFARVLGESEQIPVLLAAWLPPLVVFLSSLGALLYLEDG